MGRPAGPLRLSTRQCSAPVDAQHPSMLSTHHPALQLLPPPRREGQELVGGWGSTRLLLTSISL